MRAVPRLLIGMGGVVVLGMGIYLKSWQSHSSVLFFLSNDLIRVGLLMCAFVVLIGFKRFQRH